MKLKQITESFILHKLRDQLQSSGYFNRPILQTDQPYQANSGHNAGSMAGGCTLLPTGVPHNQRHRKFLGISNRPGSIRL